MKLVNRDNEKKMMMNGSDKIKKGNRNKTGYWIDERAEMVFFNVDIL